MGYRVSPAERAVLCDRDIRAWIRIQGMQEGTKRPGVVSYGLSSAGYDLRLGWRIKVPKDDGRIMSPKMTAEEMEDAFECHDLRDHNGEWIIPPGDFVLAEVVEHIHMPDDVVGLVTGKSSFARLGLVVNATPAEPGWAGILTLELSNTSQRCVCVHAGEGIAQLTFHLLTGRPEKTYGDKGGKYQDQQGVTVARVD